VTSVNYVAIVTKYTPPCCRASYVWCVPQNRRSKYSRGQT